MTTLAPLVILSIPKAPLSYLTLVTSNDKLVSITFGQAYGVWLSGKTNSFQIFNSELYLTKRSSFSFMFFKVFPYHIKLLQQ